jgi:hypothetical protein
LLVRHWSIRSFTALRGQCRLNLFHARRWLLSPHGSNCIALSPTLGLCRVLQDSIADAKLQIAFLCRLQAQPAMT